jgi:anti-sigma factor RsiW
MDQHRFSDERLSAWLDGELDTAAAGLDRVQPGCRLTPKAQGAPMGRRETPAGHFAQILNEPVPARLSAVAWRALAWPRWAQAAAVAGLLVTGALVGGGGVWQWQQSRPAWQLAAATPPVRAEPVAQGWVQRAALAHSVYVPEPRHAVEVRAQEAHLAGWLTRRIEMPVHLFNLQAQGFELVGGRLLPDGTGKSAQLMYQDAQARRVTVYLRKPEGAVQTEFRYERQGELGMFYWIEEGCGYALVGALPRETLLALAQAVYQQHPKQIPTPTPTPQAPAAPAPAGKG